MKSTLEPAKAWLERLPPGHFVQTFDVGGPKPYTLVAVDGGRRAGEARGDRVMLLRLEERDGETAYVRGSVVSAREAAKRVCEAELLHIPEPSRVEDLLRSLEDAIDVSGPSRGRMAVVA
jgi:hypothetical protein